MWLNFDRASMQCFIVDEAKRALVKIVIYDVTISETKTNKTETISNAFFPFCFAGLLN